MTDGDSAPGPARAPTLERQHASVLGGGRGGTTSGWIVKILLLGAADAIAIAGLVMAIDHEAWGYVAVLGDLAGRLQRDLPAAALRADEVPVAGLVLPRRLRHLPGAVHGLRLDDELRHRPRPQPKSQAIDQIQSQSVRPVEGATRYDITPMKDADGVFAGFALFDPEAEQLFLGTDTELTELDLADAQLTTLVTTGRTFVESAGDLTGVRAGDVRHAAGLPGPGHLPDARRDRGRGDHDLGRPGGREPLHARSTTPTPARSPTSPTRRTRSSTTRRRDTFVADDGTALRPGFTARVGFDNYREVFTSSEFRGPFFRVLAWNLAFAFASVVVTFALGLLLAIVFNDVRMRGRKIYRSLIIIPYALPGFMTALVWKGMFNESFGINKWLPFDVSWQSSTVMAMITLILVNMWLGYPYMFLVSTGALQSVPADLKEAAYVDGATGWKAFRKITFPLLLVSVSPLLVASFAFNFNNFTLDLAAHQRQPRVPPARAPGRPTSCCRGCTASPSTAARSARASPPPSR